MSVFSRLSQRVDLSEAELEEQIRLLTFKIQQLESVQRRSKVLRSVKPPQELLKSLSLASCSSSLYPKLLTFRYSTFFCLALLHTNVRKSVIYIKVYCWSYLV